MKTRLLVVTDLGTFKAYRLEQDRFSSSPRMEPVEAFNIISSHEKISEVASDQAGNFGKGSMGFAAINDGTTGERHNIELENRRRAFKDIANAMTRLLGNGEYESCYFAAANEINRQIIDQLSEPAKKKIEKNVHSNLSKLDKAEVLRHFAN